MYEATNTATFTGFSCWRCDLGDRKLASDGYSIYALAILGCGFRFLNWPVYRNRIRKSFF